MSNEDRPLTFHEWLNDEYARAVPYGFQCQSIEEMARVIGYEGIGLFIYAQPKLPTRYTLKPRIHWGRWIILGSAIGTLASLLLSEWVKF